MTFFVPEFAFGDGRGMRLSASDVASVHGRFTCRMGFALTSRQKVGRVQPNPPSYRRSAFDPASSLNFAIRDMFYRLADGDDPETLIAAEDNLRRSRPAGTR